MDVQIAVQPQTRAWLSKSILEPGVRPYVEHLIKSGYARSTARVYICCVAHFACWLSDRHIGLDQIGEATIRMFLDGHLPTCKCAEPVRRCRSELRAALNQFLPVLRLSHLILPRAMAAGSIEDELERFDSYLNQDCGLASTTRYQRVRIVRKFLTSNFRNCRIELAHLRTQDIRRFVITGLKECKASTAGVFGVILRSYLRYRALQGDRVQALIAAIPTVSVARMPS